MTLGPDLTPAAAPKSQPPADMPRVVALSAAVRPDYGILPPADPQARVAALYLHVPFCSTKCHYCDFYSVAGKLEQTQAYLDALAREIRISVSHFGKPRPETIFIGGGTPTLLAAEHLERLLNLIRGAADLSDLAEFTVEANPNTFDPARAKVLATSGVNRISFGAQSFVAAELAILQRDHDPENVVAAVEIARQHGLANINLDLIFGTPGQTLDSWNYSLGRALALRPDHLSCYSLTYEPQTAMTARLRSGEFTPLDESLELAIFQHTYDTLRHAGFERYEVSNYARAGQGGKWRCRHNLHYWKGRNYLGWGPAAASGYQGWHWKNIPSLNHYLAALSPSAPNGAVKSGEAEGMLPLTQVEHLPPVRRAGELLMLWFRLTDGVNFAEFQARTGVDLRPRLEPILKRYDGLGFFAEIEGGSGIRMTDKAVPVSDALLREMLTLFR
ncbi:MAG: radical SAM family heme chaperone HemW [Phycisphaerae bacterium]